MDISNLTTHQQQSASMKKQRPHPKRKEKTRPQERFQEQLEGQQQSYTRAAIFNRSTMYGIMCMGSTNHELHVLYKTML
jgi:hypothetical protein